MIEVNHDAHEVSIEQLKGIEGEINGIPPTRESVSARLNAPVTSNHIDMEKISFERNKSGIWGWRSEKSEDVNGYECKVYAASNVEFITRTRTEHLSESQARVWRWRNGIFLGGWELNSICFLLHSFVIPVLHCKTSSALLKKNVRLRVMHLHPNRNLLSTLKIMSLVSQLQPTNIFRMLICVVVMLVDRGKWVRKYVNTHLSMTEPYTHYNVSDSEI